MIFDLIEFGSLGMWRDGNFGKRLHFAYHILLVKNKKPHTLSIAISLTHSHTQTSHEIDINVIV